jgi:cyanophycinase
VTLPRLARRPGRGWLVLVGGASGHWATTEAIDRAAIAAIRRDGPIAFLPSPGAEPAYGASFLEQYGRLGAPEGRIVDLRDASHVRALGEASLVYISGGDTRELLAIMAGSPALDALARAHDAGAVIVGASAGAIAMAAWGVPLDPTIEALEGWDWLPDAIVSPHHDVERASRLRTIIDRRPAHVGVGLPDDTALALGPDGETEVWGIAHIEVVPGEEFGET